MPNTTPELAANIRSACMRLVRRVRYQGTTLPPHHFAVLAWLDRRDSMTSAELAAAERVSAPSMSRTVGELADKGFIERTPDESDKRRINLSISTEGREILKAGRKERDTWMVERLKTCTPEELDTLHDAADILDRLLQEH